MINDIYLNISAKCDLRCSYCYAHHGLFKEGEGMMDIESVQKAIDWLLNWMGKTKFGSVCFFGGEPLLNWKAIVFAVEYAKNLARKKKKRIGFSIITNGTLFNQEKIAFMRKHRFAILISIDSHLQKINDALRPSLDKGSSFKKVLRNLNCFKTTDDVGIRATVTQKNLDIRGYVQYFSKIKSIRYINFYWVGASGSNFAIPQKGLNLYKKAVEKYLDYLFLNWGKGNIIYPYVLGNFTYKYKNFERIKNPLYCEAGRGTMTISAKGFIYPCALFVGEKKFCLGNVKEGIDEDLRQSFLQEIDPSRKKKCRKCRFKLVCGGGCHFSNYMATGRTDVPNHEDCELFKFHWECAKKVLNKIEELLRA